MKTKFPIICKAIFLILFSFVSSITEIHASHYRGGTLTWQQAGGNSITFTLNTQWRRGFFSGQNVGQTNNIGNFQFGDGTSATIIATVNAIDIANDVSFMTWTFTKTYSNPGNYDVSALNSCCRISSLLDGNNDTSYRLQSIVNVGTPFNNPPVSNIPPIVNLPVGSVAASFAIPATDPDNNPITFRLATNAESGLNALAPAGLTLSPSGLVTMNTVGRSISQTFVMMIMIEDGLTKTPVEFFIRMVGPSAPPAFISPLEATIINVIPPGNSVNFVVSALDPDAGQTTTLNPVALPLGATMTPTLPVTGLIDGIVTSDFSWTPTTSQVGTYVINFVAQDNVGVQSLRSIEINVLCPLDATALVENTGCGAFENTGEITVTPLAFSDLVNLLYTWTGPVGFANPGNSSIATDLQEGNYSVRIDDLGTGCFVIKNYQIIPIIGPDTPGPVSNTTTNITYCSLQTAIEEANDNDLITMGTGTLSENANALGSGVQLSPGNSPGCVTLNGNFTLDDTNTFVVELDGTTACTDYDQLTVNGTATLGIAALDIQLGFAPAIGDAFTIITSTNPIVGTFAEGFCTLAPFGGDDYYFDITYTGNAVTLTVSSGPLALNTTTGKTYCSIQAAIDDPLTLDGHTILLEAGIFNESVYVYKNNITILGPNAGVDPNTQTRGAEAIIVPTEWYGIYVDGTAFTLDGFTIDGDNICDYGIYHYTTTGAGSDTIKNNIITNINIYGFVGWVASGAPSSNNVVANNYFDNAGERAVVPLWNFYANVTDNVIEGSPIGIYAENANQPEVTGTVEWKNNTISASRAGIWYNLAYGTATALTIKDNDITAVDDPSGLRWDGIWLTSLGSNLNPVITNNTITGGAITQQANGYNLWNNSTTATDGITIDGGSVSNVGYGVWVNNWEGFPTSTGSSANGTRALIKNMSIANASTAAFYINDNPLNTNGTNGAVHATIENNFVNGAGAVLMVSGDDATAQANNNSFIGYTSGVTNTTPTQVDASCNWWGGLCPTALHTGDVLIYNYLTSSVDDDAVAPGFQPQPGTCNGTGIDAFIDDIETDILANFTGQCIASGQTLGSISGTGLIVDILAEIASLPANVGVKSIAGFNLTGNPITDGDGIKAALITLMGGPSATVGSLTAIQVDVVYIDLQAPACEALVQYDITFDLTIPDAQQDLLDFTAAQTTTSTETFAYVPACIASGDLISSISGTNTLADLFANLPTEVAIVSIAGYTLTGNIPNDQLGVKNAITALMEAESPDDTVGGLDGKSISFDVVYANTASPTCTVTLTYTVNFDTAIPDAQQVLDDYIATQNASNEIEVDFAGLCLTGDQEIGSISGTGTIVDILAAIGALPAEIGVKSIAGFALTGNPVTDGAGIKNALIALMGGPSTTIAALDGTSINVPVVFFNTLNAGCEATVTYIFNFDSTIPTSPLTLSCPAAIEVDNDPDACGAEVAFAAATGGLPTPITVVYTIGGSPITSPYFFPIGTTTVDVTATNNCTSLACSFTVTVNDTQLPAAICQNITVQLDATGNASITTAQINNGSSDNCGIASIGINQENFDCSHLGPNSVMLTVTDVNGNSNSCVATVTVQDVTAPTIACPSGGTRVLDQANLTYLVSGTEFDAGASDNCGYTLSHNAEDIIGAISSGSNTSLAGWQLPVGVHTITFTATDPSNNSSTCDVTVTVVPIELSASVNLVASCTPRPVRVRVYPAGGNAASLVGEYIGNISTGGTITLSLPDVAPGNYDFYVKPEGYLQRKIANVAVTPSGPSISVTGLKAGDISGGGGSNTGINGSFNDNFINTVDLSLMLLHYNTASPASGYNLRCDLNCNGFVDALDLSFLSFFYFNSGDQPTP